MAIGMLFPKQIAILSGSSDAMLEMATEYIFYYTAFSIPMLMASAIITMIIACFTPLTAAVYSIPNAVIGGISIYLFGVIAAQGITIMMEKKVDMFDSKNLAVISTILIIGLGGSFGFAGDGMIPIFGLKLPAIATAAIVGILLSALFLIGKKPNEEEQR